MGKREHLENERMTRGEEDTGGRNGPKWSINTRLEGEARCRGGGEG